MAKHNWMWIADDYVQWCTKCGTAITGEEPDELQTFTPSAHRACDSVEDMGS